MLKIILKSILKSLVSLSTVDNSVIPTVKIYDSATNKLFANIIYSEYKFHIMPNVSFFIEASLDYSDKDVFEKITPDNAQKYTDIIFDVNAIKITNKTIEAVTEYLNAVNFEYQIFCRKKFHRDYRLNDFHFIIDIISIPTNYRRF